eukprot:m.46856 g.46856  ORF g.46856 m.46856 type:complete len:1406 (+) comp11885_c1_seq1:71-4288(+)
MLSQRLESKRKRVDHLRRARAALALDRGDLAGSSPPTASNGDSAVGPTATLDDAPSTGMGIPRTRRTSSDPLGTRGAVATPELSTSPMRGAFGTEVFTPSTRSSPGSRMISVGFSPGRPSSTPRSHSFSAADGATDVMVARRVALLQSRNDTLQAAVQESERYTTSLKAQCDEYERALSASRAKEAETASNLRQLRDQMAAERAARSPESSPSKRQEARAELPPGSASSQTTASSSSSPQNRVSGDAAGAAALQQQLAQALEEAERYRQQVAAVAQDLDTTSESLGQLKTLFLVAAVGVDAAASAGAATMSGSLTMDGLRQLAQQMDEERELRNCEVAELEGMLAEALADLQDLKASAVHKSRESDHFMDDTLADFQDENIHLSTEVRTLEHKMDRSAREMDALETDNRLLENRIQELEANAERLQAALGDARLEADKLRTHAVERQLELSESLEQRSSLQQQVDGLSEKLHAVMREKQALDREYMDLSATAQLKEVDLHTQLAELEASTHQAAEQLAAEMRATEDERESNVVSTKTHRQELVELELELKVARAMAEQAQAELVAAMGLLQQREQQPSQQKSGQRLGALPQPSEKQSNHTLSGLLEALQAEHEATKAKLAEREEMLTKVMQYLQEQPQLGVGGGTGEQSEHDVDGRESGVGGGGDEDEGYAVQMDRMLKFQRGLERAYREVEASLAERDLETKRLEQTNAHLRTQLETVEQHLRDNDLEGALRRLEAESEAAAKAKARRAHDGESNGRMPPWGDAGDGNDGHHQPQGPDGSQLGVATDMLGSSSDDGGLVAAQLRLQVAELKRALTDQYDELLQSREQAALTDRLREALAEAKDSAARLVEDKDALELRCRELQAEMDGINAALQDTRDKLDSAAHAGLSLTDLIRTLQQDNEQLKAEVARLTKQLEGLAACFGPRTDGSDDDSNGDDLAARLRRALLQYEALKATLDDYDADAAATLAKLASVTSQRDVFAQRLKEALAELDEATAELERLRSTQAVTLEQVIGEIPRQSLYDEASDPEAERDGLSCQDLLEWIENAKAQMQSLEDQLAVAVSQVSSSRITIEALKQRVSDLLDELNERKRQIMRLEVDVVAEKRHAEWLQSEQQRTRDTVEQLFALGELNKSTIAKQEATIARLRADVDKRGATPSEPVSASSAMVEKLQQQLLQTLAELDALRTELDHQKQLTRERFLSNWQPDSKRCSVCSVGYSLFVRAHHCRLCGVSACSDCCDHRLPTTASRRPARVCKRCFDFVNAMAFDSLIDGDDGSLVERTVHVDREDGDTTPFGANIRFTTDEQGIRATLTGFAAHGLVVKKLIPLVVGDELVELDGTPCSELSQGDIVDKLQTSSVTLKVRAAVSRTRLTATLSDHSLAQLEAFGGESDDDSDDDTDSEDGG